MVRGGKLPSSQSQIPTGAAVLTSLQFNPLFLSQSTMELTKLSWAQMYLVVESKTAYKGSEQLNWFNPFNTIEFFSTGTFHKFPVSVQMVSKSSQAKNFQGLPRVIWLIFSETMKENPCYSKETSPFYKVLKKLVLQFLSKPNPYQTFLVIWGLASVFKVLDFKTETLASFYSSMSRSLTTKGVAFNKADLPSATSTVYSPSTLGVASVQKFQLYPTVVSNKTQVFLSLIFTVPRLI